MSQLYARVFLQILDSSIAGDWQVRHVFEDVLKLVDRHGVLDITRDAFARRTNTPLDVVNRAIERLENPDPESRDPEHEGRRIVRLDEHRTWGWRVVNWEKYERIRNAEDNRQRQRRFYQKHSLPPAPPTQGKPETDTTTTTETKRVVTCPNGNLTEPNGAKLQSVTCEIPSQKEVVEYGSMHGCTPDLCKQFWAYYENNRLWLNRNGVAIYWQGKLMEWRDRPKTTVSRAGNGSPAGIAIAIDRKIEGLKAKLKQAESQGVITQAEEDAVKAIRKQIKDAELSRAEIPI